MHPQLILPGAHRQGICNTDGEGSLGGLDTLRGRGHFDVGHVAHEFAACVMFVTIERHRSALPRATLVLMYEF